MYDVEADPDQVNNLADDADHAAVKARLAKALDLWMKETGDSVPENISRDSFDRETGKALKLNGKPYSGVTPGEDRGATTINASGPK